mmetsp:Transcript_40912/g.60629  ORF Transcript_40912/g.60629 Transcript_40912/m.60629 type:complete len:215 (+) Transcript_40912:497-1141(+)
MMISRLLITPSAESSMFLTKTKMNAVVVSETKRKCNTLWDPHALRTDSVSLLPCTPTKTASTHPMLTSTALLDTTFPMEMADLLEPPTAPAVTTRTTMETMNSANSAWPCTRTLESAKPTWRPTPPTESKRASAKTLLLWRRLASASPLLDPARSSGGSLPSSLSLPSHTTSTARTRRRTCQVLTAEASCRKEEEKQPPLYTKSRHSTTRSVYW